LNIAVVSQTHIGLLGRKSNHGKLRCTSWRTDHAWLNRLWLGMDTEVSRIIAVNDIPVMAQSQWSWSTSFRSSGVSRLRSTGPFLSGEVFFGKSLLSSLGFPVVIADAPSMFNDPATKLSEHRPSRDNSNLSGAVGERQDFLVDQILFLGLSSDDLEQRPILVEQ
jgi:hypothetical protein